MNTKGEIILELQNSLDGYISSSGLTSFRDGLAFVQVDYSSTKIPEEIEEIAIPGEWISNGGGNSTMRSSVAMFINTDFKVEFKTYTNDSPPFSGRTQGGFSEEGLCYVIFDDYSSDGYVGGFIDRTGELVIPTNFKSVWEFNEGYAVVYTKEEEYALIDTTGNIVTILDDCRSFIAPGVVEGILMYQKHDGKWGAIDPNGNVILDFEYDNMFIYSDGYAWVDKDGKLGLVNKNGELITEIIYDFTGNFYNGYAPVCIENKWGLLNSNGDEVIPLNYDRIGIFNSSFVALGVGEHILNEWGHVISFDGEFELVSTQTGEVLIDTKYNTMDYIENNAFIVSKDGKYGIIDISGNELVSIEYDKIIYNVNFTDIATAIKGSECYVIELK